MPGDQAEPGAHAALASVEEEAKTWAAQAQAALADEHLPGATRSLLGLHALLVPLLDRWLHTQLPQEAAATDESTSSGLNRAAGLSSAVGLLGLWRDLPDVDVEHESIGGLLVWHAARAASGWADEAPLDLILDEAQLPAQREWLISELAKMPPPRSRWWRRMSGARPRSLGDRARIVIQRGSQTVLERLPAGSDVQAALGPDAGVDAEEMGDGSSWVGSFRDGDRLTLQWPVPLPGQIAVLHARGDEYTVDLDVLVPQHESEAGRRRQHEIVEIVGELEASSPAAGATETRALVLAWVPEVVPPRWVYDVLTRRRLPPEARAFCYRYAVTAQDP